MAMRSFPDRVRHALMFEIVGLAIVIPAGSYLFGLPAAHMGVIGIVGATVATLWNFLFNLGFDHALLRLQGHTRKSMAVRVAHAVLFEIGLLAMLLPMIAWYLGVSLVQAFLMDMSMVVFYVVYAFVFNIAYDRVFPVRSNQPAFAG